MKKQSKKKIIDVSFISLGCFKNLVDTEVLGGLLEKRDIRIVSPYEKSDWIIINTCGFVQDAKEESIQEILGALEKKEQREVKHVAVFGCLTQRYYRDLLSNFKDADILWGVNDLDKLADMIADYNDLPPDNQAYTSSENKLFLYNDRYERIITTPPNMTFIKISEGCSMKCSFCAIPVIRGPYRSRPIDSITREAEKFKSLGFKEINLISQNSTFFGKDRSGKSELPLLLNELSKLRFDGIRVLYLMPEEITGEIIDAFSFPSIIPYFDLPFQHISKNILKSMNRSGGFRENLSLVRTIRDKFKDSVVRSSFIVGYPGETDENFNELMDFARESEIERIGVFGYSEEENTAAFSLEEKVDPVVIVERREQLMDISDQNLEKYNRRIVGKTLEFIPLGPWDNNTTIGRIMSQSPEIDGLTRVNAIFDEDYSIYKIKITGFEHELLQGEKV